MIETLREWLNDPFTSKLFTVAVGLLVIWIIFYLIGKRLAGRISDVATRYHSRKAIRYSGFFISLLYILIVFSRQLGGAGVALGVAGAGIAFALQEVFASIAGWLAVSFGGFYRVGDRVQRGGIKGDVIDVGVLRTTLMEIGQWVDSDQYNGRIVRIANSFVFKEPVFNYSADFPFLWDEIKIPIRFGSDYQRTAEIMEKIALEVVGDYTESARNTWKKVVHKYMIEDAATHPAVTLTANDNWVEFTLRYIVDFKKRRSVKDRLFSRLLEEFAKTEGRVQFASSTIHLVDVPEVKVRIKE